MKLKKLPSNRTFGLFSIFFLIFFLYDNNKIVSYTSFFLSITFFILGVINAKVLFSLNYFWIKFRYFLGMITSLIGYATILGAHQLEYGCPKEAYTNNYLPYNSSRNLDKNKF